MAFCVRFPLAADDGAQKWSPATHCTYPPHVRRSIEAIMLVRVLDVPFSVLPCEVIFHVRTESDALVVVLCCVSLCVVVGLLLLLVHGGQIVTMIPRFGIAKEKDTVKTVAAERTCEIQ